MSQLVPALISVNIPDDGEHATPDQNISRTKQDMKNISFTKIFSMKQTGDGQNFFCSTHPFNFSEDMGVYQVIMVALSMLLKQNQDLQNIFCTSKYIARPKSPYSYRIFLPSS